MLMISQIPFSKSLVIWVLLNLFVSSSWAFSFSEYEQEINNSKIVATINKPGITQRCLAGKKIATVIGERHVNGWGYENNDYGSLTKELNGNFKKLGLKTSSPEEITAQIAKAEQEAFLNNDLDAALNAAERLGADLLLRGIIYSKTTKNPVLGIDEVFVTLNLSLVERNGQTSASVKLSDAAFSDADTMLTVLRMIKQNAQRAMTDLYNNYCKNY